MKKRLRKKQIIFYAKSKATNQNLSWIASGEYNLRSRISLDISSVLRSGKPELGWEWGARDHDTCSSIYAATFRGYVCYLECFEVGLYFESSFYTKYLKVSYRTLSPTFRIITNCVVTGLRYKFWIYNMNI